MVSRGSMREGPSKRSSTVPPARHPALINGDQCVKGIQEPVTRQTLELPGMWNDPFHLNTDHAKEARTPGPH
jgi:hypothetical protein